MIAPGAPGVSEGERPAAGIPLRARPSFSQRVPGARSLLTTRIAKWEQAGRLRSVLPVEFAVELLLLDEFRYKTVTTLFV